MRGENIISENDIIIGRTFSQSCIDTILKKIMIKKGRTTVEMQIEYLKIILRNANEKGEKINKEELCIRVKNSGHLKLGRNKILQLIQYSIDLNYFTIEKGQKNLKYIKEVDF